MDAHRTQQIPAGPHAHEPRGHRLRRNSHGAVPAAQDLGAAELKPSSMIARPRQSLWRLLVTTARSKCAWRKRTLA
eukprot:scaffold45720_cov21-Phaeocystis_antarctica.AAC.1